MTVNKQAMPEINSEHDYQEVRGVLSRKKRPAKVLRMMMNALESYRQSRKYGWSRPWNKYDLLNFQSFKLNWQRDEGLLKYALDIITQDLEDMPIEAREFCTDLVHDNQKLMGFIFTHQYSENGKQYEGATLSLGQVNNKRYRDRLDIIVESPVENGKSLGLQRIRVYVDPYDENRKEALWSCTKDTSESSASNALFARLADISWDWADSPEHTWNHWTSNYIDYFGERDWVMEESYFHLRDQPEARIPVPDAENSMSQTL